MTKKEGLHFFEISPEYVDYLRLFSPHIYKNKQETQKNTRKYIGIVLEINGFYYFAPLTSFKEKHVHMKESLDLIKVKNYAVVNLNNMFPVPLNECSYVDFSKVEDINYRNLLLAEYRYIRTIENKIYKNAEVLYNHKVNNGTSTPLAKRCNDFILLETKCNEYGCQNKGNKQKKI